VLGLKGAASHLVGRIPYFSMNNNLLLDVLQVSGGVGAFCMMLCSALAQEFRILPS
jgi:hypothetical protein